MLLLLSFLVISMRERGSTCKVFYPKIRLFSGEKRCALPWHAVASRRMARGMQGRGYNATKRHFFLLLYYVVQKKPYHTMMPYLLLLEKNVSLSKLITFMKNKSFTCSFYHYCCFLLLHLTSLIAHCCCCCLLLCHCCSMTKDHFD